MYERGFAKGVTDDAPWLERAFNLKESLAADSLQMQRQVIVDTIRDCSCDNKGEDLKLASCSTARASRRPIPAPCIVTRGAPC
jgi:hypothetical protein